MDEMLFLTRTVARAAKRPLVVGDMPFGSYQVSDEDAVRNAIRFVKEGGADAVKLEGGGPCVSRARAIVERGDPGDGPRRPDAADGDHARRLQGAGQDAPRRRSSSSTDALELEDAGLLLGRARGGARRRSRRGSRAALAVPTIGIGAGAECDGQVLVYHDLLGLNEGHLPRFVKRYAKLRDEIRDALEGVRRGGAQRRVPRGAAHLRDARGGAARVRGASCRRASSERRQRRQRRREPDASRGSAPSSSRARRGRRSTSSARSSRRRIDEAPKTVAAPPVVSRRYGRGRSP